jgi:hypothetical protein
MASDFRSRTARRPFLLRVWNHRVRAELKGHRGPSFAPKQGRHFHRPTGRFSFAAPSSAWRSSSQYRSTGATTICSINSGAQSEPQTSEANDREQQDEVASSESRVTRLAVGQGLAFGNAEMARFRHA